MSDTGQHLQFLRCFLLTSLQNPNQNLNFFKVKTKYFVLLHPMMNYFCEKSKHWIGKAIYFVSICSFNLEYPLFTTDIYRHPVLALLFKNISNVFLDAIVRFSLYQWLLSLIVWSKTLGLKYKYEYKYKTNTLTITNIHLQ